MTDKGIREAIVIGSGPPDTPPPLYAARAQLKPLLFGSSIFVGGSLTTTTEVENFPGFRPKVPTMPRSCRDCRCPCALRRGQSPIQCRSIGGQPVWLSEPTWPLHPGTGEPLVFVGQFRVPGDEIRLAYLFLHEENWDMSSQPEDGTAVVLLQPGGRVPPVAVIGPPGTRGRTLWRWGPYLLLERPGIVARAQRTLRRQVRDLFVVQRVDGDGDRVRGVLEGVTVTRMIEDMKPGLRRITVLEAGSGLDPLAERKVTAVSAPGAERPAQRTSPHQPTPVSTRVRPTPARMAVDGATTLRRAPASDPVAA